MLICDERPANFERNKLLYVKYCYLKCFMDLLKSIIHIKGRIEFLCNTQNLVNINCFKNVLFQIYRYTHKNTFTITKFRIQVMICCNSPLTSRAGVISVQFTRGSLYNINEEIKLRNEKPT